MFSIFVFLFFNEV